MGLLLVWTGDPAEGQQMIAPLRALGTPVAEAFRLVPYLFVQSLLDAGNPHGAHYYWRSQRISEFTDDVIDVPLAHTESVTSPMSYVGGFLMGGAVTRVGPEATALGRRDPGFEVNVALAGDAKVTLIDPRDVAAVAAVVLTEDGHEGRTYTVTGLAAVTYAEVADELSAAIGRPVAYVDVPDPAAREGMIQAGLSEWLADQLVILWGQLRRGAATTTDVVRVLTGREPHTVADFGRDFAHAFRS